MWWRRNPCNSATEVANSIVLSVALGAQGSAMARRPFLLWDAVGSQAIITKETCDQAAIDARPVERPWVALREGLHREPSDGCGRLLGMVLQTQFVHLRDDNLATPSHCVRTIHDVSAWKVYYLLA